ncbi:MAG: histidine--tRNA ligase [Patescibacteria group bacterium]
MSPKKKKRSIRQLADKKKKEMTKKKKSVSVREPRIIKNEKYIPHLLRGMRDILPVDRIYWDFVNNRAKAIAAVYGFERIETPTIEDYNLFERGTGMTSEVVEKQMYDFIDKGGGHICCRPEGTPSVVRAYIEHGMFNLPQPLKLYYYGSMFRHEKPQAGRLRQLHQFGVEVIGSEKPIIDAQVIMLSRAFCESLGLNPIIEVNSIGCSVCRKVYRRKLTDYFKFRRKQLCSDCQRRLEINPLRILDCKEKECQELSKKIPQIIDYLCVDCHNHFTRVLEYLDEAGASYELNYRVVRGLDYYTRTVFEVFVSRPQIESQLQPLLSVIEEKEQEKIESKTAIAAPIQDGQRLAIGGGGRYDNLVEILGGKPTPACGVAFGLDRIVEELKIQNIKLPKARGPQVFIAQLGDMARQKALKIFEVLRKDGFRIAENFSKDSLRAQLETAHRLGTKLCLIIGHQEVLNNTIIIRDMLSGSQEIVDQDKIAKELHKKIK